MTLPSPTDKKMYVLVNRSMLTLVQCGVQASHAVAEFMDVNKENSNVQDWVRNHKTMIFLEANLSEMAEMKTVFMNKDKKYKSFFEPDLRDLETACAFEPVTNEEGKAIFGHLKLVK